MYREIDGDLIKLALEGKFDVIAHGCNCFCTMGAGIAPLMAKTFACDLFPKEMFLQKGNIDKLGTIDYELKYLINTSKLFVVNAYTQYGFGRNHIGGSDIPLDYDALTMCMRKINHIFKGKHIGLPQIGCGLAGGDWNRVKTIIQSELKDCDITIVIFKK